MELFKEIIDILMLLAAFVLCTIIIIDWKTTAKNLEILANFIKEHKNGDNK